MNRRKCINCQTARSSVADHELDAPHICPHCGDELVPMNQAQPEIDRALARTAHRG